MIIPPLDYNCVNVLLQRPDGDRGAGHQLVRWAAAAGGLGSCPLQRRPHGYSGERTVGYCFCASFIRACDDALFVSRVLVSLRSYVVRSHRP